MGVNVLVFLIYKNGTPNGLLYGYNLYDTFNLNGNYTTLNFDALKQYAKSNQIDLVEFNTHININSPTFFENETIKRVLSLDGFIKGATT